MDVGGRDLALVIDHQMELKAKEPAHGTAAPLGHSSEYLCCLPRALWQTASGVLSTK